MKRTSVSTGTKRARRATPGRERRGRYWVRTVTTTSTAPPSGLFTQDARTIARVRRARPRVSAC